MKRTRGRYYADLRTYFRETGDTQIEFGRRINKHQSYVSKVLNGALEPSIEDALLISKVAGVPLESLTKRYALTAGYARPA